MNTIHVTIHMSPDGDSAILLGTRNTGKLKFHECAVWDIADNLAHLFPNAYLLRPEHATELEELVSRQMKDGFVEVHLRYEVREAECWEGWKWSAPGLVNGPTTL